MASIRSASLGVSPDTGSRVMSLTEKIPNCMACLLRRAAAKVHVFASISTPGAPGYSAACWPAAG
jgi:hypothetical protein